MGIGKATRNPLDEDARRFSYEVMNRESGELLVMFDGVCGFR